MRDGLHRFIAMLRSSIIAGVIFRALFCNPGQYFRPLFITHLTRPVKRGITRWRHSFILHHPFNLIQIALRNGFISQQCRTHGLEVKRFISKLNVVIHQLFRARNIIIGG
ncbi:Uncharacterised protein [Shigella sonnei]|nr:Uncharacterised protein [Shigella sonnei]